MPCFPQAPRRRAGFTAGFTLVELLIVVVILGILAAIVIPTLGGLSEDARRSAFATDLTIFVTAAELFLQKTGDHVEDASSGTIPSGFDAYVKPDDWEKGTPIGGVWDTEKSSFGLTSAVGVHFLSVTPKDDAYMVQVDELLDDGNLSTGTFRKIASDRFYYVLMP